MVDDIFKRRVLIVVAAERNFEQVGGAIAVLEIAEQILKTA